MAAGAGPAVGVLSTDPFHGYSTIFSPFTEDKLAVVGGRNYGISGAGCVIVFSCSSSTTQGSNGTPRTGFRPIRRYEWKDVLFDVTWSELHEPILVVGSGDGGILIYDQTRPEQLGPVAELRGHNAEVCSVQWSLSRKDQLVLSSSWDTTIRIWDCVNGVCVSVWEGHTDKVYCAQWSPKIPNLFASVSGDSSLKIWDVLSPQKINGCVDVDGRVELLTCSWNTYNESILATGSTDNIIRIWDIRQLTRPLTMLTGHTQSIKCVSFDPHSSFILASCGYDSTVRFWNTESTVALLQTIAHHKEFTYSIDFSCHNRGVVADCSWDKTVKVYTPSCLNTVTPTFPPPFLPPN